MNLRVLLNPKAAGGSAAQKVPEIRAALRRFGLEHDVVETRSAGHAPELVRQARADGVKCILVVGGDGTLNGVSQGYLDDRGEPLAGPDLGLIPAGTGGDFRRTFGLDGDIGRAVQRFRDSEPRPVDLGILRVTDLQGAERTWAFVNITSFGIGGLTDRIVNDSPKWMGGRAAFFLGTFRAMFAYRNAPVRVTIDGKPWFEGPILNVALANGRFFGGGMKIAPEADPSDGLFDVVALRDLTRLEGVALSSKIYRGAHLGQPKVESTRGAVVEATPTSRGADVLIDMDGETPGRLPLSARVARGALRNRV
jgi:diacylglycerol kinase (ATP)